MTCNTITCCCLRPPSLAPCMPEKPHILTPSQSYSRVPKDHDVVNQSTPNKPNPLLVVVLSYCRISTIMLTFFPKLSLGLVAALIFSFPRASLSTDGPVTKYSDGASFVDAIQGLPQRTTNFFFSKSPNADCGTEGLSMSFLLSIHHKLLLVMIVSIQITFPKVLKSIHHLETWLQLT